MTLFRRRAPVRGAATQGVARVSAPATSRGSASSGSRRSTESSGFTDFETDFGSPALGFALAATAPTALRPAAPAPAASALSATAPAATTLSATTPAATAPSATAPAATASSATSLAATPTEDLFQQYMQAYLEDCQNLAPAPAPAPPPADAQEETSDRPLKARNLDLHYGNSHIECYYFCQKCKEHFDTEGAIDHKRVPFAAFFLKDRILYRWQQHKASCKRSRAVPLFWKEFKDHLRKSLSESNAFVGSVWSRMRGDFQYQLKEV